MIQIIEPEKIEEYHKMKLAEELEKALTLESQIEEGQFMEDEISEVSYHNIYFDKCKFINCKIEGNMEKTDFKDVIFENCDFSNLNLNESSFVRCEFKNCKLVGTTFINNIMLHIRFEMTNLKYANLSTAN